MNMILWVVQAALSAVFLWAGAMKILKPATLKAQGLDDLMLLIFIGTCEILGALGLILPALTHLLPWLTPLAAVGIAAIMGLACRYRLKRHEIMSAAFTLIFLALSAFVAYGRWALSPLA